MRDLTRGLSDFGAELNPEGPSFPPSEPPATEPTSGASNGLALKIFVGTSFVSRLGDHLAEFGMALILLARFPGLLWPALAFSIVRGVTTLLLGRWLGSLFDVYPVRRVLGVAIALQLCSLLLFAGLTLLPEVTPWHFLPASVGLGIGGFLYEVGLTYSLLPALVSGPQLNRLTTLFQSLHQFAEVGGPLLAGLLFAWGGVVPVLVVDGATFGIELIGLMLLSVPARAVTLAHLPNSAPTADSKTTGTETTLSSSESVALEGMAHETEQGPATPPPTGTFLWSSLSAYHPALPYVVLTVGLAWINGMSPYSTTFLFFLKEQHGMNEAALSWVRTGGALAAILGTLAFPWLTAKGGKLGTLLLGGIAAEALALVFAAWFREQASLLVASVLLSRVGLSLFIVASIRLRQDLIPASVRGVANGRINAFYRGMGLLGLLAQLPLGRSDQSFWVLAWGTAGVFVLAAVFTYPAWRLLSRPALSAPSPDALHTKGNHRDQ